MACTQGAGHFLLHMAFKLSKPRRVPPSADGGKNFSLFFPMTCASGKTLLRPQTCESGTQTKPCEADLFGRGGARERSDAPPSGWDERCGLCPDDVRCRGLQPLRVRACTHESISSRRCCCRCGTRCRPPARRCPAGRSSVPGRSWGWRDRPGCRGPGAGACGPSPWRSGSPR